MGVTQKVIHDEYIEQLWYMKEQGEISIDFLKSAMPESFDEKVIEELFNFGLIDLSQNALIIKLTESGEAQARQLIRAHRLAERLIADVLGGGGDDLEKIACEFEHTVSGELVNSICTLLGHPKECPHGMPIPEGECCKLALKTELSLIVPLADLKLGESARIAYINCRNDQQIHKLEGLCIRPGVLVKLHQNYPTYVIECEGASIALDKEVIANICVWKNSMPAVEGANSKISDKKNNVKGLSKFFHLFKK
ncbi:MAG: metal-dependent transcriptional regulator [Candidatus Omnitrophica bacterium]|nr:metal-dependent transcriptional regulator [Candidatus Omnitrophota bacterium]